METEAHKDLIGQDFSPANLENQMVHYLALLEDVETVAQLKHFILVDFSALLKNYVDNTKDGVDSNQPNLKYAFSFDFPERVKDLAILHRNVYVELVKGCIRRADSVLSEDIQYQHFIESKAVLVEAVKELVSRINEQAIKAMPTNEVERSLSLLQNPWATYQKQFEQLDGHIKNIGESDDVLVETMDAFVNIQEEITAGVEKIKANYYAMRTATDQLIGLINQPADVAELVKFTEKQLESEPEKSNSQKRFNEDIGSKIGTLKSLSIPVSTNDGEMTVRKDELQKTVQLWLDYRISPILVDLWEIEDSLIYHFDNSLTNIKNSLLHRQHTEQSDNFVSIREAAEKLRRIFDQNDVKLKRFVKEVDILDDELIISNIFKDKAFLEIPFEMNLNLRRDSFVSRVKTVLTKFSAFRSLFRAEENLLSEIELSAQCLSYRMLEKEDMHYDSLFLNKDFIGDLYLVPRAQQEEKLADAISQWKTGFSKTVLVTGNRMTGKSTFLTYTGGQFFGKHIVALTPNSTATIDGRKFKTGTSLKEALKYVKIHNNRSTQPVIIIDDLAIWRDKKNSLISNVRALIDFMETIDNRAFIMVSTTPMMRAHLDNRFGFSSAFTTHIDLNKASVIELEEIFQLRHGASHRQLVNEESEPISPERFKGFVDRIGRLSGGNIGCALRSWVHHVSDKEENKLFFSKVEYDFYDFFTNEEIVILKHIMLYRRVTVLELKQVSKHSYEHRFQSAVRRLINTKVLIRENQFLIINPVVIREILKILIKRDALPKH